MKLQTPQFPFVSNAQELDSYIIQYTEVQSQQMAFTQSPSLSNNPKIPTYYLIFAVIKIYIMSHNNPILNFENVLV